MSKKTDLQERALEQELTIYHDPEEGGEAKELTIAELEVLLADHATAMQAQADEAAEEKTRVRDSAAAEATRVEAEEAEAAKQKEADVAAAAAKPPEVAVPATPATAAEPTGGGSKKDKALAREHSYPVVVAKGTAYRSHANIRCPSGGGLRRNGSVIILNAADAKTYAAHITEL